MSNVLTRNVKKLSAFIIVLLFCLPMVACKEDQVSVEGQTNTNGPIEVMSGYNQSFLPLLNPIRVNNCSFSVRSDLNYVMGKDIYSIEFESSSSMDQIAKYYKETLDTLDEEMSYDAYTFEGLIGDQRVSISISEEGFLDAKGPTVRLTYGMKPSEYVDQNPYFDVVKDQALDMSFVGSQVEYTYREDVFYNFKSYRTSYITTEMPDTILAHYRNLYGSSDQFEEKTDEYGTTFTWVKGPNQFTVTFHDSVGTDFISLDIKTPYK